MTRRYCDSDNCNRCRDKCPDEKVKRGEMTPWQTGDPMDFEDCQEEGYPNCYGDCQTCAAWARIRRDKQTTLHSL